MKSFIPLLKKEWRLLLFGFVMTFASSLGQTYFIALFSGEIRQDLNLSHGLFGSIYSAATLLSAAMLLWTGSWVDRMDLRHYSFLVIAGLAAGCVLLGASRNLLMLFLSMLLLRHFGQGLMSMAATTSMVRYIDEQKGKASALSGMGYSISEAVLPSLIIATLAWLSWRQTWFVAAAIMVLVMPPLIYQLLRNHGARHDHYIASVDINNPDRVRTARRQWTRGEVLRDPLFYLFMPALLAQPMLFTGFMFHQVHMVEEKGWPLAIWGSLYLLYAITTTITKLTTGVIIDRFGAVRLVPLMSIPMGLGLLALSSSSDLLVAVMFMFLLGLAVGSYSTVSSPFFAEMYGTLHLGSIKSVTTSAMVFASALAPACMGWFIDRSVSIDTMALWGVAYVILACALAWHGFRAAGRRPWHSARVQQ